MTNCLKGTGHKCQIYRLYERPPGHSFQPIDAAMYCRDCRRLNCSCLGIHLIAGATFPPAPPLPVVRAVALPAIKDILPKEEVEAVILEPWAPGP